MSDDQLKKTLDDAWKALLVIGVEERALKRGKTWLKIPKCCGWLGCTQSQAEV